MGKLYMHRNGDACRTTNDRATCIRMGVMCYRVYNAVMVAIELLYTHRTRKTDEVGEREKPQDSLAIFSLFNYTIIIIII